MKIVVTGGSGFIGSNLVDRLLLDGHQVTAIDDLSTGHARFLDNARTYPRFEFQHLDLLSAGDALLHALDGADAVAHLAANADVRFGWEAPSRDLEQNVIATHRVLEAVRRTGVPRLLFTSTGSVYGEAPIIPTPETCPFPRQTSLYAASKLAAEGYVQAYAEGTDLVATIVRFVSILGARYTHGHVIDFVRSLKRDPERLRVLGDGTQRKSYLEVSDCIAAVARLLVDNGRGGEFNLGVDSTCTVRESIGWIAERLSVSPRLEFTGGDRGWIGDNPHIHLSIDRIRALGWEPQYSIREGIERTVAWLVGQDWLLSPSSAR